LRGRRQKGREKPRKASCRVCDGIVAKKGGAKGKEERGGHRGREAVLETGGVKGSAILSNENSSRKRKAM